MAMLHSLSLIFFNEGTHGTGKTGKMAKNNSLSGKTQGIWKYCQNTRNLVCSGVTSMILKVQDILIFAAKISNFWGDLAESAKICRENFKKYFEAG